MRLPNFVRAQGLWPRLMAAAVVVLAACDRNTTAPDTSTNELRGRAVALDVDLDSHTVRQAPVSGSLSGANPNLRLPLTGA